MPRVREQHDMAVRRAIRDAMAIDPLISMRQLQAVVEKRLGRTVDDEYIKRLVLKVKGDVTVRVDLQKIAPRIATMREDFRLARENLLRIAYGEGARPTADKDRIAAWKAIGMLSKILLDAEMDLGIFERKGPTDDQAFRYAPVPVELWDGIMQTFKVWRFPTDLGRRIEPERFIEAEATVSPPKVVEAPVAPQNGPISPINATQPAKQLVTIPRDPEFRIS